MSAHTNILRSVTPAAAALVLSWLLVEPASSDQTAFADAELVEFASVSYTHPLSPFKVKQAKKKGITLEPKIEPSISLKGFLAKPEGNGPFPAVVLMQGCASVYESDLDPEAATQAIQMTREFLNDRL